MSWIKEQSKEIMATVKQAPGTFTLNSVKDPGQSKTIRRLDPDYGEKIVGVRIALEGSDTDEFTHQLS